MLRTVAISCLSYGLTLLAVACTNSDKVQSADIKEGEWTKGSDVRRTDSLNASQSDGRDGDTRSVVDRTSNETDITTLSRDDQETLCEELEAIVHDKVSLEQYCLARALEQLDEDVSDPSAECSDLQNACITDESDSRYPDNLCLRPPRECNATVGEALDCYRDTAAVWRDRISSLRTCSELTATYLSEEAERIGSARDRPPSCDALNGDCRRLLGRRQLGSD